jgi:hypothetical protein
VQTLFLFHNQIAQKKYKYFIESKSFAYERIIMQGCNEKRAIAGPPKRFPTGSRKIAGWRAADKLSVLDCETRRKKMPAACEHGQKRK